MPRLAVPGSQGGDRSGYKDYNDRRDHTGGRGSGGTTTSSALAAAEEDQQLTMDLPYNDAGDTARDIEGGTSPGRCTCTVPGWEGPYCNQRTCPTSSTSDAALNGVAATCSGHGTCLSAVCFCRDGFTGKDCSLSICPSGLDFVGGKQIASPCSARGICTQVNGVGVCDCDVVYAGLGCERDACPGEREVKENEILPLCGGHGVCIESSPKKSASETGSGTAAAAGNLTSFD